jgi:hypothetical protein
MTHAWCHDTARDAAVRAAEDGRDRPLPTLGEAIARPFACAACGGFGMDHRCRESCEECDGSGRAMIPKSVSASSAPEQENKGVRMTKSDRQAADYRAEAIARPFAGAAKCSSTVSEKGEGQSGMRTERVVLEITQFNDGGYKPVSEWDWEFFLRGEALTDGESVRVVEDEEREGVCNRADMVTLEVTEVAEIVRERDTAIRERDELKARVAELEAASGGRGGEGGGA